MRKIYQYVSSIISNTLNPLTARRDLTAETVFYPRHNRGKHSDNLKGINFATIAGINSDLDTKFFIRKFSSQNFVIDFHCQFSSQNWLLAWYFKISSQYRLNVEISSFGINNNWCQSFSKIKLRDKILKFRLETTWKLEILTKMANKLKGCNFRLDR